MKSMSQRCLILCEKEQEMERLTSNKPVADMMPMIELAHNSCYIDEKHNARYRDYEQDIDSRELVRKLVKDMCDEDLSYMSDERFDQYMAEMLSVGVSDTIGLLAVFYRNLWAMAELREKLKEYEDLEEQGLLLKLPCKVGDILWTNHRMQGWYFRSKDAPYRVQVAFIGLNDSEEMGGGLFNVCYENHGYMMQFNFSDIGKTVFLIREEAEEALKIAGGENVLV